MPIANYTTTVAAIKSIGEIQEILVAHGARAIMMEFDAQREITSLAFILPTQFGEMPFRLPANVKMVQKVLEKQREMQVITRKMNVITREMALRVAWRILKDWVRAQMAIIETEMVTIDQVFLPYRDVGAGKTLYEAMVENRLALLPGGKLVKENEE